MDTKRLKNWAIKGSLAALVCLAVAGHSNKMGKTRMDVEGIADTDKNGTTSVEEWKGVYDFLGVKQPRYYPLEDSSGNQIIRIRSSYDGHECFPGEDLSYLQMRDYLDSR